MNPTSSPIRYATTVDDVSEASLEGFFEGWPNPPGAATLKELLTESYAAVVAIDDAGQVVGFVTAISDGVMNAFIPLLEVRRDQRGLGIGRHLVTTLLQKPRRHVCGRSVLRRRPCALLRRARIHARHRDAPTNPLRVPITPSSKPWRRSLEWPMRGSR